MAASCSAVAGLAVPAQAAATHAAEGPSTLAAGFTTEATASPTGMALHIVYRRPGQSSGPPPAVTRIDITLPGGTAFDGAAVPVCEASDAQIMSLGRLACPPGTQIGDGSICADVGTGPLVETACTDTVWYNGPGQLIEVVEAPGPGTPAIARERLQVGGGHLSSDVSQFPGGPPNQTDVTEVKAELYPRGDFFATPVQCPSDHLWSFSATFGFNDGTTQTAQAFTPCRP